MDPAPREHILFICTANVDRSPTAEDLYQADERFEVRSAGLAPFATVPLTRDLIRIRVPNVDRPLVDLDIEDRWSRGDPELVGLILRRLRPYLGAPRGGRRGA
jgi:predicted protein tyrosine phosphatase